MVGAEEAPAAAVVAGLGSITSLTDFLVLHMEGNFKEAKYVRKLGKVI